MALVATSLDDPASSWLISLSEADAQDWSTLAINILTDFDSVTPQKQFKPKLKLHNSTHINLFLFMLAVLKTLLQKAGSNIMLKCETVEMSILSFKDSLLISNVQLMKKN